MLRRSTDSENSGDYNWRRLWETPSKKSHRRYARASVHPLPGDLQISEALAILKHPTGPLKLTAMSSNPVNPPIEDLFLRWRQEMEAKQEEQARQMAELQERADHLQQENDRLRTRLESSRPGNTQGDAQNEPLARANKGKEPLLPDHSDHQADDELSSNNSPLPRRSPPLSNAEAKSRKRPPRQSSRAMSGTRRRVRREDSRDGPRSQLAPEHIATRFGGAALPLLHTRYPPGALPFSHAALYPPVQGPYDMLSSPLGQHILDYEPPRGFVIPPFAMYDGLLYTARPSKPGKGSPPILDGPHTTIHSHGGTT